MPRSSILLGVAPVTGDVVAAAAASVAHEIGDDPSDPGPEPFGLRVLDDGAVLQVIADGAAVVSVLRPRRLPNPDEVGRLLPGAGAPDGAEWWTEAYTPWRREGAIGVAILDAVTAASGAIVVHQDPTFPRRAPR